MLVEMSKIALTNTTGKITLRFNVSSSHFQMIVSRTKLKTSKLASMSVDKNDIKDCQRLGKLRSKKTILRFANREFFRQKVLFVKHGYW